MSMGTLAFALCFAVWTFLGIRIRDELELTEAQFDALVSTPILRASLTRVILGV